MLLHNHNHLPRISNRFNNHSGGFTALIAVILVSAGTMAFSLSTLSAAVLYADSVFRKEMRIQVELNTHSCLDTATVSLAKDFFMNGTTTIRSLGCEVSVINPNPDLSSYDVEISVTAALSGIRKFGKRSVRISDNSILVISQDVW
ncbi:MAG: hypothetical protein A3B11_01380 [Candidatus Taylorbacteria bacterium RIFCSPLOWO2_01_FULL_44_26]|uniref:Uncharacterized protein n=2 Tax=Candidatus Tayloriibacteriota TaxID=1817919 RepID=A0A1G2MM75_9BACT|nr:MAG: hypothetical protein A3D50_01160 [Candidatus Taylorbacteria bacterium RIFCSPHIGHO2_02_FULL_44_12]OHA30966.1 MAG: hypothetical protein A3B11_01380 [Candidatus Taylorbacteria bacterium RIFCSPLOWO2_01_FULL_44_26]